MTLTRSQSRSWVCFGQSLLSCSRLSILSNHLLTTADSSGELVRLIHASRAVGSRWRTSASKGRSYVRDKMGQAGCCGCEAKTAAADRRLVPDFDGRVST